MKAQSSVEFIILLGILTMIFSILINYSAGYQFYSDNLREEQRYKEICNQVKTEVESAIGLEPVYTRNFYLPEGDYNVSIKNYEIIVLYRDGSAVCYVPVNFSAELSKGKNTIVYNETGLSVY